MATDDAAPGGAGGDGKAAALTVEDVNKQVHAILTEREKRTLGKIDEMFKSRDAAKAKAKEERQTERAAKKAEKKAAKEAKRAAGGEGDKAPATDGKRSKAEDARLKALEQENKTFAKRLADSERAREQERLQRLADEERSSAAEALSEVGVVNVKGALALLREEKRIGRDKDGQIVLKVQRDGFVEDVPIKDAVKAWAETDEGKFYLPPAGAAGSGATGGTAPNRSGRAPSRQEKISEAMNTLGQLAYQRPTQ